jgi:hypothetical protein
MTAPAAAAWRAVCWARPPAGEKEPGQAAARVASKDFASAARSGDERAVSWAVGMELEPVGNLVHEKDFATVDEWACPWGTPRRVAQKEWRWVDEKVAPLAATRARGWAPGSAPRWAG